jgi:nucleotide-binding universal stress UspA family protein
MAGDKAAERATTGSRTYMVVIDESEEARIALRFATRRAIKTGGHVLVLAIIPPTEFIQWSGVQAAMEEEAETRAQGLLAQIAGEMMEESGIRPSIMVRQGEPAPVVAEVLESERDIHALVLGAAAKGGPGPLVTHFAGETAGQLRCPVMIIPGGLGDEALDLLS